MNKVEQCLLKWNNQHLLFLKLPPEGGQDKVGSAPAWSGRCGLLTVQERYREMSSRDSESTLIEAGDRETKERLQITVTAVSRAGLCGLRKGSYRTKRSLGDRFGG